MKVIDQKPVPIYEVICDECKSKIHYKASEVRLCHITCPVCGTSLWAHTTYPVEYERVSESVDVVEVVRCGDCIYWREYIDFFPTCFINREVDGSEKQTKQMDFCSYGKRRGDGECTE